MTLPFDNSILSIDNSQLDALCTCPRSWEYAYAEKRVLATEGAALRFGSAVHAAMEYRYGSDSFLPVTDNQLMVDVALNYMSQHPIADEGWRNSDALAQLITSYNKKYQSEDFTIHRSAPVTTDLGPLTLPFVEQPFSIPLAVFLFDGKPITVHYTGRIDLVVRQGTSLLGMDHKTSSILGPIYFDDLNMSPQQLGYMWAIHHLTSIKPVGYIMNVLGSRAPTRTGVPIELHRQTFYKSWDLVEEWFQNTLALLNTLFAHLNTGYLPMFRKSCVGKYGRCPFYEVCSLPSNHRKTMLSSQMFKDNTWSPLDKQ